ncbi:hypothetical protein IID19_03335 [Patescibacteria group bacterium]|nr:hypothetical protein [Patescibacteria group bacterium]
MTPSNIKRILFLAGGLVLLLVLVGTFLPVRQAPEEVPPVSPSRNVAVLEPLIINALPGLVGNTTWSSGFIILPSPVSLAGLDGVFIDVEFMDAILQMKDLTGTSLEKLTVELFGTVVEPDQDISGEPHDEVAFGFYFDDLALLSDAAGGTVNISSANGSGLFQQSVNLTDTEFLFGGLTLEIYQDGAGSTEITGLRISLEADAMAVEALDSTYPR